MPRMSGPDVRWTLAGTPAVAVPMDAADTGPAGLPCLAAAYGPAGKATVAVRPASAGQREMDTPAAVVEVRRAAVLAADLAVRQVPMHQTLPRLAAAGPAAQRERPVLERRGAPAWSAAAV